MSETLLSPMTSAVAETRLALENIERWNPKTKAMLAVTAEQARATAEELDRAGEKGEWRGLLHGMTISLKDNIDLAGVPTTAGSKIRKDSMPNRDAFLTERLKRHGAVIVGKANLHEWVFGPTSQSKHYGPCRNPWNTDHVPGGSSGGSGASVASGMCVGSIGSDTAGSIRIPASFNGVAGLRPSVGRISNRGTVAVSAPFDTCGPLARRVSDVARIFSAIAGYDPEDPISAEEPVPNVLATLDEPVAGLRLGVMRRFFFDDLDPDLGRALDAALEVYRDLGVEIVEIDIPEAERSQEVLSFVIVLADAYSLHQERLAERPADYGDDVYTRFMIGKDVTGAQYAEGMRWIERFRHSMRKVFREVDAIFEPTTPFPAPAADYPDFIQIVRKITRQVPAWAAAGIPSLAMPCGFSSAGLPLSFQLASRWFDEATILRLGHAYQKQTDHHLKTPIFAA